MSAQDLVDAAGYMLLAWAAGYTFGYLLKVIRKIFEVSGLGGG